MSDVIPMYGFDTYWHREVYYTGVEKYIAQVGQQARVRGSELEVIDQENSDSNGANAVMWVPVLTFMKDDLFATPLFHGHRLYAREKENGNFVPVLEMRKEGEERRLFAQKNFQAGEVITFMSLQGEENVMLGLGGGAARVENDRQDCNAYLTRSGALRCTKDIGTGEEIVRWNSKRILEFYEKIGRLVISPRGNLTGTVNPTISEGRALTWIDYSDGSKEIMKKGERFGWVYTGSLPPMA